MKRKNKFYGKHLLKSHETVTDFAFRKRVYLNSVYSAIEQGKIIPDVIGISKTLMIDLRKYGSYRFQVRNPDKSALIRWFLSTGYIIRGKKVQRKARAILYCNARDKENEIIKNISGNITARHRKNKD